MKLDKNSIILLIDKLKPSNVLVLGDLILDEFIFGYVNRLSREAPIPIIIKKTHEYVPGGAANAANNITSLGGKAFSIGVVGNDISGVNLLNTLKNNGINTDFVIIDSSNPTTTKTRISASSRQSVKQQVARLDTLPSNLPLSKDIENKIIDNLNKAVNVCNTILISDYKYGVISDKIIEYCNFLSEKNNINLIVDSQDNLSKFQKAKIITPNQPEAEDVVGFEIKDKESLYKAGKKLLEITNSEAILITRGSEGMALFESNGDITEIPAFNKKEVFDVTAGDTVVSTISLALANNLSLKESMYLANLAASIVVKRFGTSTTNLNEMKEELLNW
ncbi:MAG: ADP-heptose synthase [Candidatus Sericytochromatia bacterium]|nr:MAG: ADP-heptose synthase [Candidatus Sericytochromatia bacterium]